MNTENKNSELSDEIAFSFQFGLDGQITHVWGGKDTDEAFSAKTQLEELAEKAGMTPLEYVNLNYRNIDKTNQKVDVVYGQRFIEDFLKQP